MGYTLHGLMALLAEASTLSDIKQRSLRLRDAFRQALDESSMADATGPASTSFAWLLDTLQQSKPSAVFEACGEAMPLLLRLVADAGACSRVCDFMILLLNEASQHTSGVVRRLAFRTATHLAKDGLRDPQRLSLDAAAKLVSTLACLAYNALREPLGEVSVPASIKSPSAFWSDDSLGTDCVEVISFLLSASCIGPSDAVAQRLQLLRILMIACENSGSLLLTLDVIDSADCLERGAAAQSLASARASITGLSPVPLPMIALLIKMWQACDERRLLVEPIATISDNAHCDQSACASARQSIEAADGVMASLKLLQSRLPSQPLIAGDRPSSGGSNRSRTAGSSANHNASDESDSTAYTSAGQHLFSSVCRALLLGPLSAPGAILYAPSKSQSIPSSGGATASSDNSGSGSGSSTAESSSRSSIRADGSGARLLVSVINLPLQLDALLARHVAGTVSEPRSHQQQQNSVDVDQHVSILVEGVPAGVALEPDPGDPRLLAEALGYDGVMVTLAHNRPPLQVQPTRCELQRQADYCRWLSTLRQWASENTGALVAAVRCVLHPSHLMHGRYRPIPPSHTDNSSQPQHALLLALACADASAFDLVAYLILDELINASSSSRFAVVSALLTRLLQMDPAANGVSEGSAVADAEEGHPSHDGRLWVMLAWASWQVLSSLGNLAENTQCIKLAHNDGAALGDCMLILATCLRRLLPLYASTGGVMTREQELMHLPKCIVDLQADPFIDVFAGLDRLIQLCRVIQASAAPFIQSGQPLPPHLSHLLRSAILVSGVLIYPSPVSEDGVPDGPMPFPLPLCDVGSDQDDSPSIVVVLEYCKKRIVAAVSAGDYAQSAPYWSLATALLQAFQSGPDLSPASSDNAITVTEPGCCTDIELTILVHLTEMICCMPRLPPLCFDSDAPPAVSAAGSDAHSASGSSGGDGRPGLFETLCAFTSLVGPLAIRITSLHGTTQSTSALHTANETLAEAAIALRRGFPAALSVLISAAAVGSNGSGGAATQIVRLHRQRLLAACLFRQQWLTQMLASASRHFLYRHTDAVADGNSVYEEDDDGDDEEEDDDDDDEDNEDYDEAEEDPTAAVVSAPASTPSSAQLLTPPLHPSSGGESGATATTPGLIAAAITTRPPARSPINIVFGIASALFEAAASAVNQLCSGPGSDDSAGNGSSSYVTPGMSLGGTGCNPYLASFGAPALRFLTSAVAALNDPWVSPSCAAAVKVLLRNSLIVETHTQAASQSSQPLHAPPLMSLLCRLAIAGEHGPSAASSSASSVSAATEDEARCGAVMRAHAAATLCSLMSTVCTSDDDDDEESLHLLRCLESVLIVAAGADATAVPTSADVTSRGSNTNATCPALFRRQAAPGSPTGIRQARTLQLVAAVAMSIAARMKGMGHPFLSTPQRDEELAVQVRKSAGRITRLLYSIAAAPLAGPVRQYLEAALGAWLAAEAAIIARHNWQWLSRYELSVMMREARLQAARVVEEAAGQTAAAVGVDAAADVGEPSVTVDGHAGGQGDTDTADDDDDSGAFAEYHLAPRDPFISQLDGLTGVLGYAVSHGQLRPELRPFPLAPPSEHASDGEVVPLVILGWSNAIVMLTALTIAHELRMGDSACLSQAMEAALAHGMFTRGCTLPWPDAVAADHLPQSLLSLTQTLLCLSASTQRRAVREAAQCCLNRLLQQVSRWKGVDCGSAAAAAVSVVASGTQPPEASNTTASADLLLLFHPYTAELEPYLMPFIRDGEVWRLSQSQSTLMRRSAGDILRACVSPHLVPSGCGQHEGWPVATSLLLPMGFLYCLLTVDNAVPSSEAAPLDVTMNHLLQGMGTFPSAADHGHTNEASLSEADGQQAAAASPAGEDDVYHDEEEGEAGAEAVGDGSALPAAPSLGPTLFAIHTLLTDCQCEIESRRGRGQTMTSAAGSNAASPLEEDAVPESGEGDDDEISSSSSLMDSGGMMQREAALLKRAKDCVTAVVKAAQKPLPALIAQAPPLPLYHTKASATAASSSAALAQSPTSVASPLSTSVTSVTSAVSASPGRLTIVASLLSKHDNIGSVLRSAEALCPPDCGLSVLVPLPIQQLLGSDDVTRAAAGAGTRLAAAGALTLVDPRHLRQHVASAVSAKVGRGGGRGKASGSVGVDVSAAGGGREVTRVIAVELTSASVPLHDYRFFEVPMASEAAGAFSSPSCAPESSVGAASAAAPSAAADRNEHSPTVHTILILGNEVEGVPASVLASCHACVAIPQYGSTASLNVATAASIALCEFAAQRHRAIVAAAAAVTGTS